MRIRKAAAEFLGTAFLLMSIVGSGIMGERLAAGNTAIALLANSLATGGALLALILMFGAVSGAHFNPVVTLFCAAAGTVPLRHVGDYIFSQAAGGIVGTGLANLMFRLPLFSLSPRVRTGPAQTLSEFLATFGLILLIAQCSRFHAAATPYAVAAYVTAGYWFTSSTALANPAVTLARTLTATFSGIRPSDAPAFIAVQLVGGAAAFFLSQWMNVGGRPLDLK